MPETLETPKAMVPPSAVAASNVGADNICIKDEVRAAAQRSATGLYKANMAAANLDRSKLIAKVCAIVKSKRGLAEKQLPKEVYEEVCNEVSNLLQSYFDDVVSKFAGMAYKSSPVFRKAHETAPVAVRHTLSSVQEIGFKEQRLLLDIKLSDANDKLRKAYAICNDDRITKWTRAVSSIETMLAALTEAELIASETAVK